MLDYAGGPVVEIVSGLRRELRRGFVGVVLIGLVATEVMTAGPRASSAVAASSRSASKCLPR